LSANPIHPDDLEFQGLATNKFIKEFQTKFTEGAERNYKLGPFKQAPGRINTIKEEVLDQWSYVVRLEMRDLELSRRLHSFITRVPLSKENKAELELILEELLR